MRKKCIILYLCMFIISYGRVETGVKVLENLNFERLNFNQTRKVSMSEGVILLKSKNIDIGKELELEFVSGVLDNGNDMIAPWKVELDHKSKKIESTTQQLKYYVIFNDERLEEGEYKGALEFQLKIKGEKEDSKIVNKLKELGLKDEKLEKLKEKIKQKKLSLKAEKLKKKLKQQKLTLKTEKSEKLKKLKKDIKQRDIEKIKADIMNFEKNHKNSERVKGILRRIDKKHLFQVKGILEVNRPLILSMEEINGTVIDDMKVEFPYKLKGNIDLSKDYDVKYSVGKKIDLDKDGVIDTYLTKPEIKSDGSIEGSITVDGKKLSKDGDYKKSIYMLIERDIKS